MRLPCVMVSDIMDSDHLARVFRILDRVKTENISEPIEKFTDWKRFQSLDSILMLHRIEMNSVAEVDKAALNFTAPIVSKCRLYISKVTLSSLNNNIPGSDLLLKHEQRLRKLWQGTRDPACKPAVNWAGKSIRRMTLNRALERCRK
jgi:hypothetical protein